VIVAGQWTRRSSAAQFFSRGTFFRIFLVPSFGTAGELLELFPKPGVMGQFDVEAALWRHLAR
jgi:hypothetical protein